MECKKTFGWLGFALARIEILFVEVVIILGFTLLALNLLITSFLNEVWRMLIYWVECLELLLTWLGIARTKL